MLLERQMKCCSFNADEANDFGRASMDELTGCKCIVK